MVPSDFVDVAILAALIYAVLTRIDRSVSSGPALRMIGTTVLLLGLVVGARAADLYLVAAFLGAVAIVYVVAVLLVLQRDLRQMLDVLAGGFLRGRSEADGGVAAIVARAAFHLSGQRTGALVALRGQESWEALVHDGVPLDGQLSEPLLYSLFDPSTPGHDGAVLVDGDQVTRFAVHLPLAKGAHVSRFGGTRHAAALGLSQECDALVVVVSEETGAVQVAERGQLTRIDNSEALRARLEAFRLSRQGRRPRQPVRAWRRSARAVLAGSVAAVLWLLIAYSPDPVERTFDVPVAYHNVPVDWAVEAKPNHVQLTLRGPETTMASLSAEDLVVGFDLSRPVEGTRNLTLREDQLALPPRVELLDTRPAVVRVTATPLEQVELPVRVPTVGRLPNGLELERIDVEPDRLPLLVPAGREHPRGVISEVLDLSAITATGTTEHGVLLPPGARAVPGQSPTVQIRTTVRPSPGS